MAGSATRSAILSLGSSQARGGAYSVFDAFFSSDRFTHLPYPFPNKPHWQPCHLTYIYMYVGRSIRLNHPSNTSLPRDARVCVCVADIQAVHRTFLIPPAPPSSLADSHPARATMTFKSPILSSYLSSYLTLLPSLPSPPPMCPPIVGPRPPHRLHRPSTLLLSGEEATGTE